MTAIEKPQIAYRPACLNGISLPAGGATCATLSVIDTTS
jgi:hypothetical protein